MDQLLELLQQRGLLGLFTVLFAVVFTVAYAYAAQHFLLRSRERRREKQRDLYGAISQGLQSGALESVEDLINVYKGVHELGADDITYRAGLSRALREFLVTIVSDTDTPPEKLKDLKSKASAALKQIEADAPYAELPAAERNLIVDIKRFVDNGDKESASRKLEDLAGLVEVRQDALERLQNSNKWSVPLAAIGLALTIIFGIVSVIK